MSDAPGVGVVLLNWNRWEDTVECLESLLRADYSPLHVVVCDQGSTDGSRERIRAWAAGTLVPNRSPNPELAHLSSPPVPKPVTLIEYDRERVLRGDVAPLTQSMVLIDNGRNLGSAGGNNTGITFLQTQPFIKYVWILNNDIVVAPDAVRELVAVAESDERVAAVGGRLMDYRHVSVQQTAGGGQYAAWRGYPTPVTSVETRRESDGTVTADLDWITGGNMLSPIAALGAVGPIDEDYFVYMEDIDHSLRLSEAGYRFAFAPRSLVWHKGGATLGYDSPSFDYYMVRNALLMARRHRPAFLPTVSLYTIYRIVLPKIARGQWRRVRTVLKAMVDGLKGVTGPQPGS